MIDDVTGNTIFHLMATTANNGCASLVWLTSKHKNRISCINSKNKQGDTAAHVLAMTLRLVGKNVATSGSEVLKVLQGFKDVGFNFNIKNKDNKTVLDIVEASTLRCRDKLVSFLKEAMVVEIVASSS